MSRKASAVIFAVIILIVVVLAVIGIAAYFSWFDSTTNYEKSLVGFRTHSTTSTSNSSSLPQGNIPFSQVAPLLEASVIAVILVLVLLVVNWLRHRQD